MKLALIVCDEPREPLLTRYGGYPQMFTDLFNPSSTEGVAIAPFDLFRQGQLPTSLAPFDGIIISGSVHSANEPLRWIEQLVAFVRTHYSEDPSPRPPPLLGICFGHQIICRAWDVSIVPSAAWEVGWTQMDLSPPGQDLFATRARLRLISSHREEAARVPEGFANLGSSAGCSIQGIYSPSRSILALQGHPEIRPGYIAELAERRLQEGTIPPEVHAHVMATRDKPVDREILLEGFRRFFNRHRVGSQCPST